jgi:hypothetical protein
MFRIILATSQHCMALMVHEIYATFSRDLPERIHLFTNSTSIILVLVSVRK